MTNDLISESTEKQKTEKRAVISISVSAEEKRRISVEALKDYSTTVSDLIRSRMFLKSEQIPNEKEIEDYKEVIEQQKQEIQYLKDSQVKTESDHKETDSIVPKNIESIQNENGLLLDFKLNDSGDNIIEKIKSFRSGLSDDLEEELQGYNDFEKFAKSVFLRGLKRSYNSGMLKGQTGLRISEIAEFAEAEAIDYAEQV